MIYYLSQIAAQGPKILLDARGMLVGICVWPFPKKEGIREKEKCKKGSFQCIDCGFKH
jgi:hypothetical protein